MKVISSRRLQVCPTAWGGQLRESKRGEIRMEKVSQLGGGKGEVGRASCEWEHVDRTVRGSSSVGSRCR